MKRLTVTIVVCAALICTALAQIVASPQIGITRRSDVLNKQIANMAYHTVTVGRATATRAVDESPKPLVLVQGFDNRIDALLTNAVVSNWRYALLPDMEGRDGMKSREERTHDSNNKTRRVYQLGWEELDMLQLQKGQAMFTGLINDQLDRARLGPNTLFNRAETRHANQTEVPLLIATLSFTDWRRNFLNDGIPVIVVPKPRDREETGRLLLLLKQSGYYFSDPTVDAQLTALANGQLLPQPTTVEDHGKEEKDRNRNEEFDTSKLDAPALQVSIGGKIVKGDATCDFKATTITIDAGGSFRLCVYRVAGGKEELIKDKSYSDSPLRLDFSGSKGCEYRFEIVARGQLLGTFSLKEAK